MANALLSTFIILTILSSSLSAQTNVFYSPSATDFINPERGFYRYTETRSGNYSPLNQADLADYRNPYTPFGANYSVVSSIAFRYFFLEDFKNGPISSDYLNAVNDDFATARAAGIKLIPRFAYTDEVNGNGCDEFICPPYGDAPKSIILAHINQLAPILTANKDVMVALQLGLIGTWGEGYYTDYFGDASPQGNGKWLDQNWIDRNEILSTVLSAIPVDRMVQIRYPQWKQRYLGGVNAPTSFGAISESDAYSQTDAARIGFHNDCLLASAADFGTYFDYGNNASNVQFDTTNLKPYLATDSRYVLVGGETCSDGFNPQNNCSGTNSQAYGDSELRRMHYSYLNADYNNEVNNDWQNGGCMDNIKRSLGYRFELQQGTFPDQAQAGNELSINLAVRNIGYAAPFNPRSVELILREATSGEIWRADIDEKPRRWWPGATVSLNLTACLPESMPMGDYDILLNLPDPEPSLYGRADYSIRLANELPGGADVWEPTTGFNNLGHSLTLNSGGISCSAASAFVADNQILPVVYRYFTADAGEKKINLRWGLSEEENLSHFILERRSNSSNFAPISQVPALTGGIHAYAFTDNDVQPGLFYHYRLRSVDYDRAYQYSSIVTESLSGTVIAPTLFPNPTTGELKAAWPSSTPTSVKIRVYDVFGRLQFRSFDAEHISLTGLPKGVYLVVITGDGIRKESRIVLQ